MSLRYRYVHAPVNRPVLPLGGRHVRPRPLIPVTLIGPGGTTVQRAIVDSAADDTIFPDRVATLIGLDLVQAPAGTGSGVGSGMIALRYAQVTLRLAAGLERREWAGWVGFTSATFSYPMLGFAGCLQYFDVLLLGAREEVELTVNALYPGT